MERASMPPGGRISNIRAEVSGRALAPVTFVLEPAETAAVRCVVEHAVGVGSTTVEAPLQGGSKAVGELELDVRRLPHGPALLRLTPLDAAGRAGTAGETQIVVPGCPGPGPTVVDFRAVDACVQRPGRRTVATPRLWLAYWDGGAPVTGVYLTLEGPDGAPEFGEASPPADGEGELRPFTFGATRELGAYRAAVVLVDADGNASEATEAMLEVAEAGVAAPAVERAAWRRGDGTIVVRGSGFDAAACVRSSAPSRPRSSRSHRTSSCFWHPR
jgi:hypothetical protein